MEDQQVILSAKSMSELKIRVPGAEDTNFGNADTTQDAHGTEICRSSAELVRDARADRNGHHSVCVRTTIFALEANAKKGPTQNANAQKAESRSLRKLVKAFCRLSSMTFGADCPVQVHALSSGAALA